MKLDVLGGSNEPIFGEGWASLARRTTKVGLGPTEEDNAAPPAWDHCTQRRPEPARWVWNFRRGHLVLACLLALPACSPAAPSPTGPAAPATLPDAGVDAEALPPGVIARSYGKSGLIQVEERDGLRLLTIAGVVHAAHRKFGIGHAGIAADPVVQLIGRVRPDAKSALVIGLGSGKTATDLSAAGLAVTAVEIEPVVVDFARAHFGYRGEAVVGDGLAYLRDHEQAYDVVLMDAFAGQSPPPHLITDEALTLMRNRTTQRGVTLVRGLGEPDDYITARISRGLRAHLHGQGMVFAHTFGSGVGREPQNLYFLSAERPLDLTDVSGIAMWPIVSRDQLPDFALPREIRGWRDNTWRDVALVGYVHLLREDGALALDVPHWEMGAIRYLLSGDDAESLRKRLPRHHAYPTQGDIGSDGATADTLYDVLGGGGAKRSDVRFSPLIVALVGRASLRSLVHPDSRYLADSEGKRPSGPVGDPRLPYGGVLYDLDIMKVEWAFDKSDWKALQARLRPLIKAAQRDLRQGKFAAASTTLHRYLAELAPTMLPTLPPYTQMQQLVATLDAEAPRRSDGSDPGAIARDCDRLYSKVRAQVTADNVTAVKSALLSCAEVRYEKIINRRDAAAARYAVGRLLSLWEAQTYDYTNRKRVALYEKKIARLRRRYPDVEAIDDPPPPTR